MFVRPRPTRKCAPVLVARRAYVERGDEDEDEGESENDESIGTISSGAPITADGSSTGIPAASTSPATAETGSEPLGVAAALACRSCKGEFFG